MDAPAAEECFSAAIGPLQVEYGARRWHASPLRPPVVGPMRVSSRGRPRRRRWGWPHESMRTRARERLARQNLSGAADVQPPEARGSQVRREGGVM